MKYIKLFSEYSQYVTAVANETLELPNVSYCVAENEVGFNPIVPHDYTQDYLTFEALQNSTFTLTIGKVPTTAITSVSYSVNDGATWVTTNNSGNGVTITTPTITTGNKVLWKGTAVQYAYNNSSLLTSFYGSQFSSTGNFIAYGNMMSLLYDDNFQSNYVLPTRIATGRYSSTFAKLFEGCTTLQSIENLTLPATTLVATCYDSLFSGCTALTTAMETLPATTLIGSCYARMFKDCTLLTVAPELPALTLANSSYYNMFNGCTQLNRIKMMATDISVSSCLSDWVSGVAATGTFIKNSAASWDVTGASGIPTGWTVQTASS